MSDYGLTQATVRVQEALDREGQELPWADCEIAARAAREDVAETVREARAAELEHFAEHHVGIQSPGRMAEDLVERAAAIRAGEQ